jgi:hypothetical protein
MAKYEQCYEDDSGKPHPLRTYDPLECWLLSACEPALVPVVRGLIDFAKEAVWSSFMPAKELRARVGMTHNQLIAFLAKHPEVRKYAPWRRRLCVHVKDFLDAYHGRRINPLDRLAGEVDDVLAPTAAAIRDMKHRTAAERARETSSRG